MFNPGNPLAFPSDKWKWCNQSNATQEATRGRSLSALSTVAVSSTDALSASHTVTRLAQGSSGVADGQVVIVPPLSNTS